MVFMSVSPTAQQFVNDVFRSLREQNPDTPVSSDAIIADIRTWVKWWIGEDNEQAQQWYVEYLSSVSPERLQGVTEQNMRQLTKQILQEEALDLLQPASV